MDDAEIERAARLQQIQMEALGTSRRDYLTTHDVADQFVGRLSTPNVELHRRVNQRGTRENQLTNEHRDNLAGWNSAWENLQKDEVLEEGLEDLNAGQSHRARLLTILPQLQGGSSTADEVQSHGRGGSHRRGGRGGSRIGTQPTRTARRRVPVDDQRDSSIRGVISSKLAIPSTAKSHNAPALKVKFPQISLSSGSSAGSSITRVRVHPGNFTLAPPSQFMSLVSNTASQTTGMTTAREDKPSTQPTQPFKTSTDAAPSSEAVQQVASAVLLDADATRANEDNISSTPHTYADDLLGMDIDESSKLPTPMQLSATIREELTRPKSIPPPAPSSLELIESQLASFLPVLKGIAHPDTVEKLKSVSVDLQRQIQQPASGITARTEGTQGPSSTLISKPTHEAHGKASQPTRSLAIAVEQRTLAWSMDVIASTESSSSSILGENITRWRYSRRRGSVDSRASASVGSSTALAERIDKLTIHESRPIASQATGYAQTYSTTNPFGPNPNPRGSVSGASSTTERSAGISVAGPQLPLFLRSQVPAEDPAAAIRAEYAAHLHRRPSPETPAIRRRSNGTAVTQGTPLVRDNCASLHQSRPREVSEVMNGIEASSSFLPDLVNSSGYRSSRNSSIGSRGFPRTNPGPGEDGAQPQRQDVAPPGTRPSRIFNIARSGHATGGNLPRFHPRQGNRSLSPPPGPTPRQTYFVAANRQPRIPAGPALPSFLANVQPEKDPGAAAAEQYSRGSG
ncbi:MAG: hypothetical protein Q9171_000953 [Xanthocarpia ochracea]